MRKSAIFISSLILVCVPALVRAECTASGATILYVNGIFGDIRQAQNDLSKLEKYYRNKTGDKDTKFYNGFNPSHLGGLGDLIKSIEQAYQNSGSFINDTDLKTILLQIHPQLTTQKIILVGHSQGTFYTNAMYEYLIHNGVSEGSIAVYNIATPASFVAGTKGAYLTSATDKVINKVREAIKSAPSRESFGAGVALSGGVQTRPKDPLASNISFNLSSDETSAENGGHSFSEVYLTNAPDRIISNISSNLSQLSTITDTQGDCFISPGGNISYRIGKITLEIVDRIAAGGALGVAFTKDFIIDVGKQTSANIASLSALFTSATKLVTPEPRTTNLPGSHTLVSALYGSSVSEAELDDLLGRNQGGAAVLATPTTPKQAPNTQTQGEVKGVETEHVQESFIPQPKGTVLVSPGFGGGGATTQAAVSENVIVATTSAATTSVPAATSTPLVPDGTAPTVVSLQVNNMSLSPTPLPVALTPVATTSPIWTGVITFTEDISSPPVLKDGTPFFNFTNGSLQVVNDCADSNAKTFCFTYALLSGVEAAVFWYFEVSGARDISGEVMATSTFRFILDTKGPTLTPDWLYTNTSTPTVTGSASFVSAKALLLLNAVSYTFDAVNTFWSFTVQPADQLAEGAYPIVASSTDQNGNVEVTQWVLTVDLTPPVLAIQNGPGEGDFVASTSPVSFEFLATDSSLVTYTCLVDAGAASLCTSPFVSALATGAHSFTLTASDAVGYSTTTTRNFSVLP